MSANILDGKAYSVRIKQQLKQEVDAFAKSFFQPTLAVILVGDNAASETYVKAKQKASAEVGIRSVLYRFPTTVTQKELLNVIQQLNDDFKINGILVQLPLPKQIDVQSVIAAIDPKKDVDGFHPLNIGETQLGQDTMTPCTPYGVIQLLKEYGIDLQGKHAVVVGHSQIVGRPMATLLLNENATVSVCHAFTKNLPDMTRMADILIVAVGKKHLISADMVKPGAVVVDVGINREAGHLYGDCDFEQIKDVASYLTPVPGGVGPMTIAMLLHNTLQAAHAQSKEWVAQPV